MHAAYQYEHAPKGCYRAAWHNVLRADWRASYQTSLSRNVMSPVGNSIRGGAPLPIDSSLAEQLSLKCASSSLASLQTSRLVVVDGLPRHLWIRDVHSGSQPLA